MAKAERDAVKIEGVRKQILRAVITAVLALFIWLTFTVHQLSIDVAVVKNQVIQLQNCRDLGKRFDLTMPTWNRINHAFSSF